MTLYAKPWCIDGQLLVPSNIPRLMLRSATRNGNGIVEIGDLRVEATSVPSAGGVVRDGAFVARGREDLWQGSYWGYNIGDQSFTVSPVGSGGARSDLVYVRIEDPTAVNADWDHDPNSDPTATLVVVEGVSSGTTDVPAGKTGVPLARITRPANTTTVQQSHITDLRQMLDARTVTDQFVLPGVWDPADSVGNTTDWEDWPNGASWSIDVPTWAAQIIVGYTVYGAQYRKTGGPGGSGSTARGFTRANFGGTGLDSSRYWVNDNVGDYSRVAVGGGGQLNVGQAKRGTTQTLKIEGMGEAGTGTGKLEADGGATLVVSYTFRELPRYDVPDRSPA